MGGGGWGWVELGGWGKDGWRPLSEESIKPPSSLTWTLLQKGCPSNLILPSRVKYNGEESSSNLEPFLDMEKWVKYGRLIGVLFITLPFGQLMKPTNTTMYLKYLETVTMVLYVG